MLPCCAPDRPDSRFGDPGKVNRFWRILQRNAVACLALIEHSGGFWRMIRPYVGFDPSLAEPIYHLFSGPSRNDGRNHIPVTAMFDTAIFSRIRTAAGRFARADQGNIAVLFGIAAVPILTFVGVAIDYTRATAARTSMQSALDSTALMLAKDLTDGTITTSQITTKAQAYFTALFNNKEARSVTVTATYTASSSQGSTIQLTGSGNIATDFMNVAGFPSINFNTGSTSAWGNVRMRVAMVLDNTGSMADAGKMPAMQTAANSLVDQLSALAKNDGDMYISVVPFARDVNVGASHYNDSWIDWAYWDTQDPNTNSFGSCDKAGITTRSSCTNNTNKGTWTPDHSKWTGCMRDRDQDYDTKNTPPSAGNFPTLFPAEEYISGSEKLCKSGNDPYLQTVVPLTQTWGTVKASINAMQPTGNTNQGIGLAWGWMTLGQGLPFNAPAKDSNYTYKEAIVLLSDGLNTQNRYSTTASQIDARQAILCSNAKAAGIIIYTVQVNTGGDPTSTVLQNCASGQDKFFLVTSASQTLTVFNSIGTSLSKLRVAK
jgi:Flp pilus assembly protein TadG